jgi:nucleotide-binding universal stress UspA family protein
VTGTWGDGGRPPHRVGSVVPLDGSDTGARAQPFGTRFAGRFGAEVVTVHVGDERPEVRVDVHLDGDPPTRCSTTPEHPGTLLCLSSHGRSGLRRVLLGSVAERVVVRSDVPVLVVGPEVEHPPPVVLPRTIVVAVGSLGDPHGHVVALGERWAPLLEAEVARVHVATVDPAETCREGVRVVAGGPGPARCSPSRTSCEGPLLYAVGAPAPDGPGAGGPCRCGCCARPGGRCSPRHAAA